MAASDNLNPDQFKAKRGWYHGTSSELKKGDEIVPNYAPLHGDDKVWFTRHRGDAGAWAVSEGNQRTPGSPGHVYRVKPTDPYDVNEDKDDYHYSHSPVKVIAEEPFEGWGKSGEVYGKDHPLKFNAEKNRWGY